MGHPSGCIYYTIFIKNMCAYCIVIYSKRRDVVAGQGVTYLTFFTQRWGGAYLKLGTMCDHSRKGQGIERKGGKGGGLGREGKGYLL